MYSGGSRMRGEESGSPELNGGEKYKGIVHNDESFISKDIHKMCATNLVPINATLFPFLLNKY